MWVQANEFRYKQFMILINVTRLCSTDDEDALIILEEIVCITLLLVDQESYFVYVRFTPFIGLN